MAEHTSIEWTDATWNPVVGCSVVSPGCTNCYAMRLAGTRLAHHPSRAGLTRDTKAGPVWTGETRLVEAWLDQPRRWRRPRRIFVCAHGDLFAESVPDGWIERVFAVMALAPHHTFQVLTKRSARMRDYIADAQPLPNIWLGVSVEDQRRADERIPDLLATPAALRFISAEPLLGPVDLTTIARPSPLGSCTALRGVSGDPGLDWVIVGGESGPGARPMDPDWARSLRDQCAAAGVAFFFKQHGEWIGVPDLRSLPGGSGPGFGRFDHCAYDQEREAVRVGKAFAGRLLDGVEHNDMPGFPALTTRAAAEAPQGRML